jgi:hypothetical protein
MGLKLMLNVLYTIGIFVCLAVIYWAWPLKRYEFILGSVFVAGLFIILKIKLLKDLRQPPLK